MLLVIGIMVFVAVLAAVLTVHFAVQTRFNWKARATKGRLEEIGKADQNARPGSLLLSETTLSDIPALNRLLHKMSLGPHLRRLIVQAGATTNPGTVLLSMLSLGGLAYLLTQYFSHSDMLGLVLMPIAASLPYVYLQHRKRKRTRDFEELLPEALDIIVGSLRAGFTFELALKLVAQEIPDPVGFEFAVVFEEQNLGVPMSDVLAGLRERVASDDLDLLIVALLIHRRTGGNLAEILEKTASTIRDRFRIKREIQTKTAHGRFSGFVLVLLPIIMTGIILALNPDYFMVLLHEKVGQYMLSGAVVMQMIGILVIRRIIDIKI